MASRIISRVKASESVLLVCDMQEKFRNGIKYFNEITQITGRLINACKALEVPILATEQYPKGLGHTVPELRLTEHNIPIFAKTRFSMCTPDLSKELSDQAKSVILCGIEAHVCIYHTTLDLLEKGYAVHVVADATSSRSLVDRFFAYRQLERAGANITTSECVIMGLLEDSAHPKFKEVQKFIMESAPDTGLLNYHQCNQ